MIIPVRCYSCGKVISHLYEPYRKLLDEDFTEAEALEAVGAVRYCCRRMLLTHIDLIDGLMPFSAPVITGTMQRIRPAATLSAAAATTPANAAAAAPAQQQQPGAAAAAASASANASTATAVKGDASPGSGRGTASAAASAKK